MRGAIAVCIMVLMVCSCRRPPADPDQQHVTAAEPSVAISELPREPAEHAPANSLPLSGAPRKNKHLQLEVYEAGFDAGAPAPPLGLRYFTVGLRGIALMRAADVEIPIQPYVFAQNDRGCISRPVQDATWLRDPFGEVATFTAAEATRGHLAFLVPEDTQHVRILIAPAGRGMVVAAGDEFTPSWPEPVRTIEDGSTLRVLVLPSPTTEADLPPPAQGLENVVLDFVIENRKDDQGIEFTTSQQLRLIDSSGKFIQPSAVTKHLGCRLDDLDVVPPGHSRRFQAVYEVPPGTPKQLQYRGFEVDEMGVDLP